MELIKVENKEHRKGNTAYESKVIKFLSLPIYKYEGSTTNVHIVETLGTNKKPTQVMGFNFNEDEIKN